MQKTKTKKNYTEFSLKLQTHGSLKSMNMLSKFYGNLVLRLLFLLNKWKLCSYFSTRETFSWLPFILGTQFIFADLSVQLLMIFLKKKKKIKNSCYLTLVLCTETSQLVVAIRGKVQSKPVLAANDG